MKKFILGGITLGLLIAIPVIGFAGFAPADRTTYQCITPTNCPGANQPTFNSFTNAPNYGDERAFFDAKDAGITTAGGYQDKLTVKNGQKIVMRAYIHNNANPKAVGEATATAKNTSMQVLLPTSKKTSHSASASISASNATPGTVSDTVDMTGANPFTLAFDRSAMVQVTYRPNGTGEYVTRNLPGAVFANDQTLNAAFGDWKGCFEYSALVTFTVTVKMDEPKPSTIKCDALTVAKINRTRFDFTAKASVTNATIQSYVFTTKNSGGQVVDTKTVNTSSTSANYTLNQSTVGSYTTSVVVNTDKGQATGPQCTKEVKVEKEEHKVVKRCDALDVKKVNRTRFDFTAKASVTNATIQSYVFTTKNSGGQVVDTKTVNTSSTSANYTLNQSTVGSYTTSVVVNTDKGVADGSCVKTVTVDKEHQTPVYECKTLSVTKTGGRSINAGVSYLAQGGAELKSVNYDFGDGSAPMLTDKTSVNYTYAKDGDYTVTATLTFNVGKTTKTARCSAKVSFTTPTTPVTPPTTPELPNTGPGGLIGLVAGTSAVASALHFGVAMRRTKRDEV